MEKYLKVLELMKSKGGKVQADDPDLAKVLGTGRKTGTDLTYRLHVYVSYIRRFAKLEVKTNRVGRKTASYELIRTNPGAPGEPTWQSSKYVKPPVTRPIVTGVSYDLKRD